MFWDKWFKRDNGTSKTPAEESLELKLIEANRKIALQESLINQGVVEKPQGHIYANVFQTAFGWHYEIIQGDDVCVYQDIHPGKEGFKPMTEEEARELSGTMVMAWREAVSGGDN